MKCGKLGGLLLTVLAALAVSATSISVWSGVQGFALQGGHPHPGVTFVAQGGHPHPGVTFVAQGGHPHPGVTFVAQGGHPHPGVAFAS
ncbi:MAG TPA: hypothetical protein VN822_10205 [Candidatus Acidoferrales bacterium]|nr:hypothetical protein [Candidatus Acidoferrales bacterium]